MDHFISSKPYGHHAMLIGLIIEHIFGRFKDNNQQQPLIIFDSENSFRHIANVFKDRIDYQSTIKLADRDSEKLVTVINVEELNCYPVKLRDYLEQIKPELVELQCAVMVYEGWRMPESFLNWLADARKQKKIRILGVSSRRRCDLPEQLSSVLQ